MGRHALLSASSSKRWLSCTPSARLEEQFRDEPGGSVYAEEGTAAHALAEHKLKKALKRRSKRPVSDYHCDEMEECTDGYVAFAMEQVELAKPRSVAGGGNRCAFKVVKFALMGRPPTSSRHRLLRRFCLWMA